MTEFVCTLCGRCCMGMGKYVKITGVMGMGRYAAVHELSKEVFYATLSKDFRDDFDPRAKRDNNWCPFLVDADNEGKYYCSIHDTIPKFCKNYRCVAMRIYKSEEIIGSVRGRTTLVSEDTKLQKIWDEEVMKYPIDDYAGWKENLKTVIAKYGWNVEDYDG